MNRRLRIMCLTVFVVAIIATSTSAAPRTAAEIAKEQSEIYSTMLQLRQTARDTYWEFSRGKIAITTVRTMAQTMLPELEPISPHLTMLLDEILEGWRVDPNASNYIVPWSLAVSSNTALLRGYTELRSLIWLLDSPVIDRKAIEEQTAVVNLTFQDVDLALNMLRMFLFLTGDVTTTQ